MKHLVIQDNNLSYLVYYTPKKKTLMYETLLKAKQSFNKGGFINNDYLLNYVATKLNKNGFKVADITKELNERLNVIDDLDDDSFVYRGIKVVQSQYGYSFWVGKTMNSCLSIEQAIKEIDND